MVKKTDLINAKEAAKILGLAEATIYAYAKNGRLQSIPQIDKTVKFDKKYIQSMKGKFVSCASSRISIQAIIAGVIFAYHQEQGVQKACDSAREIVDNLTHTI